ncbi:MAG: NIPSNAP family protein [Pseudomonadota bacterium]
MPEHYDLREYRFANDDKKAQFVSFANDIYIPTMESLGYIHLGVFEPVESTDNGPGLYTLIGAGSAEDLLAFNRRLMTNGAVNAASRNLSITATDAAYSEMSSTLMRAFDGTPSLQRPATGPDRIFQLRIYENPTLAALYKKIEMFHAGELEIFNDVGLSRVFFGETLVGPRLPNLTYMLSFENMDAMNTAWRTFIDDPRWKALSGKEEYSDSLLIRKITNVLLRPLPMSHL